MKKKLLAMTLAILMVVAMLPVSSLAVDYSDTSGHWAENAIDKWSDNGVLNGYPDGTFAQDGSITRGELAKVINTVMGYLNTATNTFTDLSSSAWYYTHVLKLAAAGVMQGSDGRIRGGDNITREEASVMIARAFGIAEDADAADDFSDAANISSWAKGLVGGLKAAGYIQGSNGSFNPKSNITRAEVVTIIDNMIKGYYHAAGTYTAATDGIIVVNAGGVILNGTINGDLYVAPGVGNGTITLDGVTSKGIVYVKAAGSTLSVGSGSKIDKVVVSADNVTISGASGTVTNITVESGENVTVNVPGAVLTVGPNAGPVNANGTTVQPGNTITVPAATSTGSGGGGSSSRTYLSVTTVEVVDATTLALTFSRAVDETSAETAANYTLSGTAGLTGNPSAAEVDADNSSVVNLTVDSTVGTAYQQTIIVTVADVTSSSGHALSSSSYSATCYATFVQVATSVVISGGVDVIEIPNAGSTASTPAFTATALDQAGGEMAEQPDDWVWSLETAVAGITVDADTGIYTIDADTLDPLATEFTVKVESADIAISETKTVYLTSLDIAGAAVEALFVDVDVDPLVLGTTVTNVEIDHASMLVEALSDSEGKTELKGYIATAKGLWDDYVVSEVAALFDDVDETPLVLALGVDKDAVDAAAALVATMYDETDKAAQETLITSAYLLLAEAAANDAIAALSGYKTASSVTSSTLDAAKTAVGAANAAVDAYVALGGLTDDLTDYDDIATVEGYIAALEAIISAADVAATGKGDYSFMVYPFVYDSIAYVDIYYVESQLAGTGSDAMTITLPGGWSIDATATQTGITVAESTITLTGTGYLTLKLTHTCGVTYELGLLAVADVTVEVVDETGADDNQVSFIHQQQDTGVKGQNNPIILGAGEEDVVDGSKNYVYDVGDDVLINVAVADGYIAIVNYTVDGATAVAMEEEGGEDYTHHIDAVASKVYNITVTFEMDASEALVDLESEALGSYACDWDVDGDTALAHLYYVASKLPADGTMTLTPVFADGVSDSDFEVAYALATAGIGSAVSVTDGVITIGAAAYTGTAINFDNFATITVTVTSKNDASNTMSYTVRMIPVAQYEVTFDESVTADAAININDGTDLGISLKASGSVIGMIGSTAGSTITTEDSVTITVKDEDDADVDDFSTGFAATSQVYKVTVTVAD